MTAENRDIREIIREEPLRRREILKALGDGQMTVPEIAEAISAPTDETMYWVMAMRKYRWLVEVADASDDGFFSYRAIERQGS
jgi:predicted transcriptional regulator